MFALVQHPMKIIFLTWLLETALPMLFSDHSTLLFNQLCSSYIFRACLTSELRTTPLYHVAKPNRLQHASLSHSLAPSLSHSLPLSGFGPLRSVGFMGLSVCSVVGRAASRAVSRPGSRAGRPASRPRQPAGHAASRPARQPANHAASQPCCSQPARHAAGQAGSRLRQAAWQAAG